MDIANYNPDWNPSPPTMTKEQYQNMITSHRRSHSTKHRKSWTLRSFQEFERSNASLCERAFNANPKRTAKEVVRRIETASKQKKDRLNYVHALKYVKSEDKESDMVNEEETEYKTDDVYVFRKYGSRCTVSMDLDYDQLVVGNDQFRGEISTELSSILKVDPSMIRIESVQKGSITVGFIVILVVATLLTSAAGVGAGFCVDQQLQQRHRRQQRRRRMRARRLRESNRSIAAQRLDAAEGSVSTSFMLDVIPSDIVTVDVKNKEYTARVIKVFDDLHDSYVEVEYIGDSKPYWFAKKEVLSMNSSRLKRSETSVHSTELTDTSDTESVETKVYHRVLKEDVLVDERKNEIVVK